MHEGLSEDFSISQIKTKKHEIVFIENGILYVFEHKKIKKEIRLEYCFKCDNYHLPGFIICPTTKINIDPSNKSSFIDERIRVISSIYYSLNNPSPRALILYAKYIADLAKNIIRHPQGQRLFDLFHKITSILDCDFNIKVDIVFNFLSKSASSILARASSKSSPWLIRPKEAISINSFLSLLNSCRGVRYSVFKLAIAKSFSLEDSSLISFLEGTHTFAQNAVFTQ